MTKFRCKYVIDNLPKQTNAYIARHRSYARRYYQLRNVLITVTPTEWNADTEVPACRL